VDRKPAVWKRARGQFGFEGLPPAGPGRLRTKAAGPNDSLPPACEHDVDSDGACILPMKTYCEARHAA